MPIPKGSKRVLITVDKEDYEAVRVLAKNLGLPGNWLSKELRPFFKRLRQDLAGLTSDETPESRLKKFAKFLDEMREDFRKQSGY